MKNWKGTDKHTGVKGLMGKKQRVKTITLDQRSKFYKYIIVYINKESNFAQNVFFKVTNNELIFPYQYEYSKINRVKVKLVFVLNRFLNIYVQWSKMTHQHQHTPGLLHGSTAPQEAHDQQDPSDPHEQVGHVSQLAQFCWGILNVVQYSQQRATVHLHPHPHCQDGHTCQLIHTTGRWERERGEIRGGDSFSVWENVDEEYREYTWNVL